MPVQLSIAGASAATVAAVAAAAASAAGAGIAASGQKDAANTAANAQQAASARALEAQKAGAASAQQALETGRNQARSDLAPYNQTGLSANQLLQEQLQYLNGQYGLAQYLNDPGYTPMVNSLEELQATPGYQFQLEQGQQSVNNSAAAKGSLLSGATMKEMNRFGQGLASTSFQQAWDRAQTAYQNAFARDNTQKQRIASTLSGIAGQGQNAATAMGNDSMNAATGISNIYGNLGRDTAAINQQQGQIAANQATNVANANTKGLSNINSAVQGGLSNYLLGSYLNNQSSSPGMTAATRAALANTSGALEPTNLNYGFR